VCYNGSVIDISGLLGRASALTVTYAHKNKTKKIEAHPRSVSAKKAAKAAVKGEGAEVEYLAGILAGCTENIRIAVAFAECYP